MNISQLSKTITCVLTLSTAIFAKANPDMNVRDVNMALDTTKIVAPESFEVDVHALMESWYLTRYAIMDKDADSRKTVEFEDQDYIDRLQKLPTVIEMPFNPIVRSFIKMYVERKKGLVESMLGLGLYYMPIFEEALDKYGLPLELRNLAIIESALNPNAVSKAGATGLWQFMTPTAQGEGLEINSLIDERRDPYRSSDAAARYLKKLYDTYGDWSLAIAAYNCGPGNVNKALRRAGGGKKDFWEIYRFLPSETRDYIPAFIAANYAMAYYKEHNISPVLAARPIVVDSVHVTRRVHFQQISDVLDIPMEEIRTLNPQYRADIIPGDIHPYSLVLPNLQALNYLANEDSIVSHNAELYARRDIVLPGTVTKGTDEKGGEYVEETVVKNHKVRKGETFASIAKKYGVSQAEVKRANGGKKTLLAGATLKINTVERKYIESAPTPVAQQPTDSLQVESGEKELAETDIVDGSPTDSLTQTTLIPSSVDKPADVASRQEAETPSSQVSQAMNTSAKKKTASSSSSRPTTHTIKSGENLFKIAKRYGVTVEELKKANNLTDDKINAGKKLKIPAKSSRKR
ncbi:MAG: transglycosylase SLT domain-containing protein [Muribaculaceae bacterium]|nr:transglycosylase SLT domain-containing protein [Muribaculaceae bacterium]